MTDNVFLVFMIYGLIGWIWETSYVSLRERKFVNRGFLRGPFIPIYGCAVTTMIYFMQVFFGDFTGNNMKDYLLIMVFMAIIASLWEYIVSYVMEVAFSTRWWDYSSRKFNINGRISLETSIFWGFGGFFLYKYLHPFLIGGLESIFGSYGNIALYLAYILLVIDGATTLVELVQFRQLLSKINLNSEVLFKKITNKIEGLEASVLIKGEPKENILNLLNEIRLEVKEKATYFKLERLKEVKEFENFFRGKMNGLFGGHEEDIGRINKNINEIKKYRRFYKKYPRAITKKIPYFFHTIRRKK